MDESKGKFQFAGLKFLYDNEIIDDPQLINNMKLNVFNVSERITEVELLSSYHHKSILVWIDVKLPWFRKDVFVKRVIAETTDRVQQLLPNFKFRVTTDRKIMDLALERVRIALKGPNNDQANPEPARSTDSKSVPGSNDLVGQNGIELPKESGVLQDPSSKPKSE